MDSILRQAKKQYKHKDVFAPRFAVNLSTTINNVLDCDPTDRVFFKFFFKFCQILQK
ncbi:unnamed protein product [Meloidogyne enterolobii]|uniref:Uncharacterized protein n=1 Tax=Meloidogyne enterolobii TaxID=390850 RepID=A0ACB1AJM3_MELEN